MEIQTTGSPSCAKIHHPNGVTIKQSRFLIPLRVACLLGDN